MKGVSAIIYCGFFYNLDCDCVKIKFEIKYWVKSLVQHMGRLQTIQEPQYILCIPERIEGSKHVF